MKFVSLINMLTVSRNTFSDRLIHFKNTKCSGRKRPSSGISNKNITRKLSVYVCVCVVILGTFTECYLVVLGLITTSCNFL